VQPKHGRIDAAVKLDPGVERSQDKFLLSVLAHRSRRK
jgi:hypothetical protein